MKRKFRIALDFDGVLHQYDGWRDGSIYGDPVEGSIETLQRWKNQYDLVVFTCRTPRGAVWHWIKKHYGFEIEVVVEKPHADLYIDDRGCRFDGNWATTSLYVEMLDRNAFKTWTGDDKRTSPGAQDAINKLGW